MEGTGQAWLQGMAREGQPRGSSTLAIWAATSQGRDVTSAQPYRRVTKPDTALKLSRRISDHLPATG